MKARKTYTAYISELRTWMSVIKVNANYNAQRKYAAYISELGKFVWVAPVC